MKINMIGIGKMGYPLTLNMLDNNHEVYVYDTNKEAIDKIKTEKNIDGTTDFDIFMDHALSNDNNRIFGVMLPPGNITNDMVVKITEKAQKNDIIFDGGNSNHRDSMYHGAQLDKIGAYFFDVGTSGGVSGARNGASFMIGGNEEKFKEIEPLFSSISLNDGYIYTGKTGSGHFLKLVHNAIYYGYQQSLGEGLEILHQSEFDYDLADVTGALKDSSVIRGWILEIVHEAFANDSNLENYTGHVKGSKSTNWVIEEAMDMSVPVPAIGAALAMRHRGVQDDNSFGGKVISAIRSGVGGYGPKGNK